MCTKQLLKDDVRTTERMHLNKLTQNQLHLQSTTFSSFIILSFFGFTASVLTPEDDLMSYLPQELLKECLWHPLMWTSLDITLLDKSDINDKHSQATSRKATVLQPHSSGLQNFFLTELYCNWGLCGKLTTFLFGTHDSCSLIGKKN